MKDLKYKKNDILNEKYHNELIENLLEYVDINYTEKDKYEINVKNNLIVTTLEEINVHLNKMINNDISAKENIMIGRIKNETAKRIKADIGIDLNNYSLVYNKSDVKHIYKRHIHNNAKQIPLRKIDLLLFPCILNEYENIVIDKNENISLIKWINDKFKIIIQITKKKKNITLKSMFIIKKRKENSLPTNHDNN